MPVKDLRGKTFNRFTVGRYAGASMWECRCQCGTLRLVNGNNLKNGHTQSCGCARIRHGMTHSVEYDVWANITGRCLNPKHPSYANYGGRGISLTPEWQGRGGFAAFVAHVGLRPSGMLSIERVDNSKGYEPGNVKWATRSEQMRNMRRNHWVEIDGRSMIIKDWAREKGIGATTIIHRIQKGMSPRDAVLTPPAMCGRRVIALRLLAETSDSRNRCCLDKSHATIPA